MSIYTRGGKRLFDLVGSTCGLIITAPLQLLVGALVARSMGLPILFRQQRAGLNGKPFTIVKFRTMHEQDNRAIDPLPDSLRLSRIGLKLRELSLDELPELWNILQGSMSLVGPRPLLSEYSSRYSHEQSQRHNVRPGLTGLAQVSGRNSLSWDQKFELDTWYARNVSFLLDLSIMLKTISIVLHRRGVNASGHATAPEFRPPTQNKDVGDGLRSSRHSSDNGS